MHYHDPADFKLAGEFRKAFAQGIDGFVQFDKAVFDPADDVLSSKLRELIAIAVAATTQCPYCMQAHVGAAKKHGASKEEVTRAVMVASALRAGGAFTHGYLAMKLYDEGPRVEAYTTPADKKYKRDLRTAAPDMVEGFGAFNAAVFDPADEVLSVKDRELIAIAVAATTQCPYCMDGHVANAKKAGASKEEVTRAVMVASALRAGGAYTHGFLATKLYDHEH